LQERTSIYSPVANRENFIDKKIRLLNEQESFGRQSLDCLGIKPRLSKIGQEIAEIQEEKPEVFVSQPKV